MTYILLVIIAFSPLACTLLYLRHASRVDERHHKLLASLSAGYREDSERWQLERRELLNRVQRPEFVPPRALEVFEVPERDEDEWNLVGTIDYTIPAELSDDGDD